MTCEVPSCNKERRKKRKYCPGHLSRYYRHGDVHEGIPLGSARGKISPKVDERRATFVDDYLMLVAEGLDEIQIAERMGRNPNAMVRRAIDSGCRVPTHGQARADALIARWVEHRERFTKFDFPFYLSQSDVNVSVHRALASGLVVTLGMKVHSWKTTRLTVYGHPDAPARIPTLMWDSLEWKKSDGFGAEDWTG